MSYRDIDWRRTRAVAMGYEGQIYLNARGQRPEGTIAAGQVDAERERVRQLLLGLRDPRSGDTPVKRVLTRAEAYHGAEAGNGPDLLVDWQRGYTGESGFSGEGR